MTDLIERARELHQCLLAKNRYEIRAFHKQECEQIAAVLGELCEENAALKTELQGKDATSMERSDAKPGNNILKGNGVDCATLPNDVLIQAVKDRCTNGTNDGAVLARELSGRLQAAEREIEHLEQDMRLEVETIAVMLAEFPDKKLNQRKAWEMLNEVEREFLKRYGFRFFRREPYLLSRRDYSMYAAIGSPCPCCDDLYSLEADVEIGELSEAKIEIVEEVVRRHAAIEAIVREGE